ncbi:hypothetical protein LX64_04725 [Chitinophaga skermanii]|uniref:PAP2 superfamily protein n=1 Tax=Chitinophaga skermanii TaxID=331697 RepID=A0A327Q2V5_9BACT|nr:hypothetical protein [Chitinophaga skermanii]RAI98740.1 hypothetical protein LX64_04725 [Chitinophaga skermanii]
MLVEENQFIEAPGPAPIDFPPALRGVAHVISYICHPLFLPLLVTALCVNALPEEFVFFREQSIMFAYDTLLIRVGAITILFPMLVVLLGRALGFVGSIYMKSQRDRIIPYVASVIFYFWAFYTFKKEGEAPAFYVSFFLGIFLSVVFSLVANNFLKISMHTVGWGGMIGFFTVLMWGMGMNVAVPLALIFVLSGLVATARLILNAHTPAEVYIGFIGGILMQWIAFGILG